jgi:predicted DNA-binding ribbon-helix-helix protein
MRRTKAQREPFRVERVQTGIRLEKRLLKVLKGLAEYHDMTLGDLLEGIVLHAFEGKCALSKVSIEKVRDLKRIYSMNYAADASHCMVEKKD